MAKAKAVPLHARKALRGRGGIAPTHSRPRTRWGWMVSVTLRLRFSPGKRTLCTHCTGGWVGLRAGLHSEATGKTLSLLPGIETRSPGRPARARHYRTLFIVLRPTFFCGTEGVKYKNRPCHKFSHLKLKWSQNIQWHLNRTIV
jgi:hypothetical protein